MLRPASLAALLCLAAASVTAGPGAVPDYRLPGGIPPSRDGARLVDALLASRGPDGADTWKVLAGRGLPAVPEVVRGLRRADWFGRSLLMRSLAESGHPAVEPVLLAGVEDPSFAVREVVADALWRIGDDRATASLVRLAGDSSWRVRAAAAHSLRRRMTLGRSPRETVIPVLLALARDPDRDVHLAALGELSSIGAAEGLPLYLTALTGDDDEREAALAGLTRLADERKTVAAALRKCLDRPDDVVFLEAAGKLAELTGATLLENEAATRRLLLLLASGSTRAQKVFEKIGPPAVPLLLAHLRRTYRTVRRTGEPDQTRTVLDLVESILREDAAPVLARILTEWREADPARRYAVVLARRYHAEALAGTFRKLFGTEGFADIRSELLLGIASTDPPDLARFLTSAVLSGNPALMKTAYRLLAERPALDIGDALVTALRREHTNPERANWWMKLLTDRRSPRAFDEARALLARPDPRFRGVGAGWLRVFPDREKVLDLLDTAYSTEDGRDRSEKEPLPPERLAGPRREAVLPILASARYVGTGRAVTLLARAVSDRDPVVREAAYRELGRVNRPEAIPVLLGGLSREKDKSAGREALRAALRYDCPEVADLVRRWLTGPDPERRSRVLAALAVAETFPLPPELLDALRSGRLTTADRLAALEALSVRANPEWVPLLLELLESENGIEVRLELIRTLAEIGSPKAVPTLLGLVPAGGLDEAGPEDRALAADAIEALGRLHAREATTPLLGMLHREWPLALADSTEDRHHFTAANLLLAALGRIRDPRAIPELLGLLLGPDLYRRDIRSGHAPLGGGAGRRPGRAIGEGTRLAGSVIRALVRFPDGDLVAAAEPLVSRLRKSGDLYRIDEGYLAHVARVIEDPRREKLRRPQPRRGLAAFLFRLVLEVPPRDSWSDLVALDQLSAQAAARLEFRRAADCRSRANTLRMALDPAGFREQEDMLRADAGFLTALAAHARGDREPWPAPYRKVLDRAPDDPDVLNLCAWYLAEAGLDLPFALETALAAGRRAPSDPNVIDTLGWVLLRNGRSREAAERLAEAVKLDADRASRAGAGEDGLRSPLVLYHLAAAASRAGLIERAETTLAKAIAMDDTLATAARASPDFRPLDRAGRLAGAIREGLSRMAD